MSARDRSRWSHWRCKPAIGQNTAQREIERERETERERERESVCVYRRIPTGVKSRCYTIVWWWSILLQSDCWVCWWTNFLLGQYLTKFWTTVRWCFIVLTQTVENWILPAALDLSLEQAGNMGGEEPSYNKLSSSSLKHCNAYLLSFPRYNDLLIEICH